MKEGSRPGIRNSGTWNTWKKVHSLLFSKELSVVLGYEREA